MLLKAQVEVSEKEITEILDKFKCKFTITSKEYYHEGLIIQSGLAKTITSYLRGNGVKVK